VNIKKSMKMAMAQCDMNQKELAAASGVSEVTLSKISRGIGNPTMSTINKLALATDYKFNDFIALGE